MITEITYSLYLFLSLGLTIWVARTLFNNGRIFLIDSFKGNEKMADSVNHLLVVGFYLINIGFASMFLKYGSKPGNTTESIEYISYKIGIVLMVLGAMHFFNIFNLAKMRSKSKRDNMNVTAPGVLH